jgi:hypothetical protein
LFAAYPKLQKATPNQRTALHVPSSTRSLLPLFLAENTDNDSSKGENEEFEKAVRIAKAKADIDQILKGPDAPFDLDGEIKKVEGISPPLASNRNWRIKLVNSKKNYTLQWNNKIMFSRLKRRKRLARCMWMIVVQSCKSIQPFIEPFLTKTMMPWRNCG